MMPFNKKATVVNKRRPNYDSSKKEPKKDAKFKKDIKTESITEHKRKTLNFQILKKRDLGRPFWSAATKEKILNTKYVEESSPRELMPTLRRIRLFDHRQMYLKDKFRKSHIFKWNCKHPYNKIDKLYKILLDMEKEETHLLEKVNLQKLHFPESLPLKVIRREINQVKIMWDYINIVKTYLRQLKKSDWDENTIQEVETQLRNFKLELSKLDDIKGCDAYVQLMSNISQVLNCIYTVWELSNKSLGDSLWKEMMDAVKDRDQKEMKKAEVQKSEMVDNATQQAQTRSQNKTDSKEKPEKKVTKKPINRKKYFL